MRGGPYLACNGIDVRGSKSIGPRVGRALDRRYAVDGSTLLVSDAFYLWLQIPIILVYAAYLNAQLVLLGD